MTEEIITVPSPHRRPQDTDYLLTVTHDLEDDRSLVATLEDDLRKLPECLRRCRSTARVLTQSIVVSLGFKVVLFGHALAGVATLWMVVFADLGASLVVVFNGLRLPRHIGRTPL
jgi:cation transport ATPase